MYELKRVKSFVKDFKRIDLNDSEFSKLTQYLSLLCEGKDLPKEARLHELKGKWSKYKEFHIGADKLVIYKLEDNIIYLARLGTHSQLFS